ncbi:unnamed protein product [Periconia digitata]|uniref:Uncharacterized protein n=1 Tax=Periconia digitata TaxID=1303443 RepID=A0A9W4UPJ7_9PLEO|nr:unnamed protein product [Periconia digitata]
MAINTHREHFAMLESVVFFAPSITPAAPTDSGHVSSCGISVWSLPFARPFVHVRAHTSRVQGACMCDTYLLFCSKCNK